MEELLSQILAELKSTRKLLEAGFGVQADSIQQLGVVDSPLAVKRMSISKNDGVMLEEENEGRWSNSPVESLCGRIVKLSTRLNEGGDYGEQLYGYIEIKGDILYSIRFNSEKNFGRFLIAQILASSYEQLAGVMTLSISAGTKRKTARFPNLVDSYGFKIEAEQIQQDDWEQNKESYLEQAALRIKGARSNAPMLGMGNNIQAIAPSPTTEPPEAILRKEIAVQAKSLWGDNYAEKAREHSATHFNGLSTKQMTVTQLEQYLDDLEGIKKQKQEAA